MGRVVGLTAIMSGVAGVLAVWNLFLSPVPTVGIVSGVLVFYVGLGIWLARPAGPGVA